MKKVFTILLGMFLVISMVGCVCAATTDYDDESQDQTLTTTVTFKVDQSYTVTIPSTIGLSAAEGKGSEIVSVQISKIAPDHNVTVKLADGDYDTEKIQWIMKNTVDRETNNPTQIKYLINKGGHVDDSLANNAEAQSPVKKGDVILSVQADTKEKQTVEIHCRVINFESATHAGNYEGTLNFMFTVEPDSSVSTQSTTE